MPKKKPTPEPELTAVERQAAAVLLERFGGLGNGVNDFDALDAEDGARHLTKARLLATRTPGALPAPLDVIDTGMDIDELDAATKGIGNRLSDAIGKHVHAVRAQRQALRDDPESAEYTVGDVAPLVRDLAHAADVLRRIRGEFEAAAKTAEEFIADEALSTGRDNVAVPDGDTEIVVSPKVTTATWAQTDELARVVAVVLAREVDVDALISAAGGDVEQAVRDAYQAGAAAGFVEVEQYAKPAWRITDHQKLTARLLQQAEDQLAAAAERAMGRSRTETGELVVKREPFKAGRRR